MLAAAMDVPSFYEAKMLEQQQRHLKYHDTAYNLEPNVKESPGGLRDLQTVLWIARAAGVGRGWGELARAGLITTQEARTVSRQERLIGALRARLHYLSDRREDRLVFDLQSALAREMGFVDMPARRASEQLMQRYYRAAKTVRR
jgi:[protein-PII] uridylyltransferase